jgi:cytochrome b6-f complex iron-sulfur subunit
VTKKTKKKTVPATAATVPTPPVERAPTPDVRPSRRRVLNWVWGGLSAALAAELAAVAGAFVRPRRTSAAAADALVVTGAVDDFAPGSVTAFQAGRFYLVRLDNGAFLAVDRTCTHLGCTVPWVAEQRRFACPCHASAFDITGAVLSPPAPRPLDLHPVRIENGIVKVDVNQRIRRQGFEPSQAVSA